MHPDLIRLENQLQTSILTKINDSWLDHYAIELWMKRDDLLHPIISGNKWRKLKYIIDHALSLQKDTIISMGGAWSNHLHALAFAGKMLDLKTIGIIRGERPAHFNPTLSDLEAWGMNVKFASRHDYRQLRQHKYCTDLPGLELQEYWLPEGGAVEFALAGVREMVAEIDQVYDSICVSCGTGTTLAGIISTVSSKASVIGFAALKNADFLYADVAEFLLQQPPIRCPWTISLDYHFGGFAKTSVELQAFIEDFENNNGIALDHVYTGKMMFGIYDLIRKNWFKPGQRIIAVHTGGLQGKRGLNSAKSIGS